MRESIIFQAKVTIEEKDSIEEIANRVHQLEYKLYPEVIQKLIISKCWIRLTYTPMVPALGNPGPGGYGIIMEWVGKQYVKEFSDGFRMTTNNRMELLAVIIGLETLKNQPIEVVVYSDSKYVIDAVQKKWVFNWEKKAFKDKKNPDLWKRYLNIHRKHKVNFSWIKGHNDHPQNERCDQLAVSAAKQSPVNVDSFFEANQKKSSSS